jgi:hypothetical protein
MLLTQNLWWVFLLTTLVLAFKCLLTQKTLKDFRDNIAERRSLGKKRFRAIQDLSDELSNALNNIRIITKESKGISSEKILQNLEYIQTICDGNIEHMDDIMWAVKGRECTVEDLVFKLEDYLDDVLRIKGIEVNVKKEGLPMNRRLSFKSRRTYLLFFKEAIKFIIENTHPLKVEISLVYKPNHFELWLNNQFSKKLDPQNVLSARIVRMHQIANNIGGSAVLRDGEEIYEIGLIIKRK